MNDLHIYIAQFHKQDIFMFECVLASNLTEQYFTRKINIQTIDVQNILKMISIHRSKIKLNHNHLSYLMYYIYSPPNLDIFRYSMLTFKDNNCSNTTISSLVIYKTDCGKKFFTSVQIQIFT